MRTTRGHKGMRSGISLVEMMIAIILFGVIAAVGFKYSKNYYDTSLASKQALVSSVVEQATQLSGAYDIYEAKIGATPANIAALSGANVRIITEKPATIPEISSTGWVLKTDLELGGTTATNDIAFTYAVDAVGLSDETKQEYCNVLNNIAYSSWDYNTSLAVDVTNAADDELGNAKEMYTNGTGKFTKLMCYATDSSTMMLAFIKKYDAD